MSRRSDTDRGAVTVEAAIVLCCLTLVLGLVLSGAVAMTGQLRCADAAREAARLIARGQRPLAEHAVAEIAPAGAKLSVEPAGGMVTVKVDAEPVGGLLPGIHLHAEADAALEPGVADASG
ncbi:MAG TPA: TadE family type IV pilus minor pilin [Amycolatopsis sp.]|nr:TadE family type IV pilus minor pilin [Amycolatopsis sp.]